MVKIAGTLQAKEVEIHNYEELLSQAKGKCQQLEEDYTKLDADYVSKNSAHKKMHNNVAKCG